MTEAETPIERLERQVRVLKRYAVLSSASFLVLIGAAFASGRQERFTEIDVERINVVEPDGRVALVIANQARLPGVVMNGREWSDREQIHGMIFFNGEGDEAGGLTLKSVRTDSGVVAFGHLSFDRMESDQVVALNYFEEPGFWGAGLRVSHFPAHGTAEWLPLEDSVMRLPEGERDQAMRDLRIRFMREGKWEIPRVFMGSEGKMAIVRVNDTTGRERIRMVVDSLDVARLEFLDAEGKVIQRIPER